MGRYRAPTPIGYKGPFRNMADIYQEYRNTLMNKGPYKAYFASRASYGESPRKFSKIHYSGEQRPMSEPERKEHQNETKPYKTPETKTESSQKIEHSQKTETPKEIEHSQKTETSQKIEQEKETSETENELSYEKLGLPYEKIIEGQTDISPRNRPSPYDKTELRW